MFSGVHHSKPVFHQVLLQRTQLTAHKQQTLDWNTSFLCFILSNKPANGCGSLQSTLFIVITVFLYAYFSRLKSKINWRLVFFLPKD